MLHFDQTIFALSSGALPAGVAVVRLSGRQAFQAAAHLIGELPPARKAAVKTIRTRNDIFIDKGLVVVFPGPASFTGEDCVEFHLHGGRAVVSAFLDELAQIPGLRLAEAGEFSRRAFENGKMDLVEAEGLGDLIAAETEMQRRLAVEQGFGMLSALYQSWAERLLQARAFIEAELDFADEDDVPGSVSDLIWRDMAVLSAEMQDHLKAAKAGELIRDGIKVALVGAPNAGKSSLMNVLVDRDVAIVSEIAGTTRDVLHAEIDIEGFAVKLYDTAGLREASDTIEREGIRRALEAASRADIVLNLFDIANPVAVDLPTQLVGRIYRIGSKCDPGSSDLTVDYDLCISAKHATGISELKSLLVAEIKQQSLISSMRLPSRLRQTGYLVQAHRHLNDALLNTGQPIEIRAEELRIAAEQLGNITGRTNPEQLLDVIFSAFCIGK
jgi:tRNA modification GTPase